MAGSEADDRRAGDDRRQTDRRKSDGAGPVPLGATAVRVIGAKGIGADNPQSICLDAVASAAVDDFLKA